jgi:hypothetical protein
MSERAWIDPEVVALCGISEEEVATYRDPEGYELPAQRVPQADNDPTKPHLAFPPEVYEMVLAMPDEQITAQMSEPDPPVQIDAGTPSSSL